VRFMFGKTSLVSSSSCDRKLSPMTLTFEFDLDSFKENQLTTFEVIGRLVRKLLSTNIHWHTHTRPIDLPGPLKWSVNMLVIC